MMTIYIAIILMFGLCLAYPKSKVVTLLMFVFILSVYVFISSEGHDMYYYGIYYADVAPGNIEMSAGFDTLTILIRSLGFSFFGYRVLCNSLWMAMVFYVVRKYSNVPNLVLIISMVFPNMLYGVNMRTGIAYSIVLLCAGFLLKKGKMPVIKFTLGTAVAILIHPSSAVFLLMLLSKVKISKRIFYILIAGFSILLAISLNTTIPYAIVNNFTDNERVLQWVRDGISGDIFNIITAVILAGLQIFSGVVCGYCYRYMYARSVSENPERIEGMQSEPAMVSIQSDLTNMNYYEMVQRINIAMYASIPFLFISVSAYRYLCTIYFLNIIVMAGSAVRIRNNKVYIHYVNLCLLIGLTALLFAYIMVNWQGGSFEYLNTYGDNLLEFIKGGISIFAD